MEWVECLVSRTRSCEFNPLRDLPSCCKYYISPMLAAIANSLKELKELLVDSRGKNCFNNFYHPFALVLFDQ